MQALERLGERLKRLTAHDALLLLCNCFALSKLMYILRTALCFRSLALQSYDDCLQEILSHVTSSHLESDGSVWEQATLPVGVGVWVSGMLLMWRHRSTWLLPTLQLS